MSDFTNAEKAAKIEAVEQRIRDAQAAWEASMVELPGGNPAHAETILRGFAELAELHGVNRFPAGRLQSLRQLEEMTPAEALLSDVELIAEAAWEQYGS